MKKAGAITAAVLAALVVGVVAPPAYAADYRAGVRTCGTNWSYSAANSTQAHTHVHEQAGWWNRQRFTSGNHAFKGWKGGGAVYIEITAVGSFKSYALGCAS